MPSRDPAKPGGPRKHVGKHAATRASKNALTLAEAEAKAAEAAAELARARAELLKAQQEPEPESSAAVELETAQVIETSDAVEPAPGVGEAVDEGAAEQPAKRPRTITGIRKVLPWAAATLAVLTIGGLIAADVVMLVHHNSVALRQRQSAEYAAAARQGVVTLMSLNYETVDDNVKAILDNSTGEFKKDFEAHVGDFTQVARKSKTVTTVDTAVAGVESMSDNDAVVLVAANTKVTNVAGAKEEPRAWRLTVHLAHEGDRIKMSKVDFAA
ncbi:VirB8/TrbF family protein [Mycolicibacter minnesotensis]